MTGVAGRTRMRIKSHWFKPGAEKSATEIAGAAGFIVFRIAQNALKRMRGAGYELSPGAPYFAFLAEFLAFLTLCADRIAHARGDESWRVEFTTAMANKVGGYLADNRIRFFTVDAHGILYGTPRPKFGIFAPVRCPGGVAAFGRDLESSKQVWSAEEGDPGDYNYREFYRDIGFDLDLEYIRPYIHSGDLRINMGIKYYAISGRTPHKQPYRRDVALDTAARHAGNFLFNREKQVEYLNGVMGQEPIVVSPYDAELFGHWWFEGPQFLDYLFRKMHVAQQTIAIIKGVFFSVVNRIMVMDSLTEKVVMTGGVVAHNPYLVNMMEEMIGREILVPVNPQLSGAIGAALYATEKEPINIT